MEQSDAEWTRPPSPLGTDRPSSRTQSATDRKGRLAALHEEGERRRAAVADAEARHRELRVRARQRASS